MKPPSFSLLLGLAVLLLCGWTVSAVTLNVSPNHQQFFTGESVSLSCEDEEDSSADWELKRISVAETETCGAAEGFGRLNGSTCYISGLSPLTDRGTYWCEDRSGQTSIKVTITVSDRPFIMEIPALPVIAGHTVTLRCRDRTGSNVSVNFFKFGRHRAPIRAAPEGELTIRNVQQSDEGFYWCSRDQTTSPSSRLTVIGPPPPPHTNSSAILSASLLLRLLCPLVAVTPYCISTGLLVAIYCCKKTGKTPTITMEMAQQNESGLDGVYVNDIANVTTEHDF